MCRSSNFVRKLIRMTGKSEHQAISSQDDEINLWLIRLLNWIKKTERSNREVEALRAERNKTSKQIGA